MQQQAAHAKRGGAEQLALQRQAIAVARGNLYQRVDAALQQHRRHRQPGHVQHAVWTIGDRHRIDHGRQPLRLAYDSVRPVSWYRRNWLVRVKSPASAA